MNRIHTIISKEAKMSSLVDKIEERQRKLLTVSKDLKDHFVGIDTAIDRIIHHVSAWYCAPEILTRPTTICLWGLTGVGKTDLVRRFVRGIGMQDSFLEMQMTNKGSSSHGYSSTMQSILAGSNVEPAKPGILMLDEIQRFRSIDGNGEDIHDYKFQDLWMLLSDGSFGGISDNKSLLLEMLIEDAYEEDYRKAKMEVGMRHSDDDEDEEDIRMQERIDRKRKFKMGVWSAKQMKRQLRLKEPVEEIMTWDSKRKLTMVEEKMSDQSIYDAEVYDQLLVFVSGNLDEAYKMASNTNESDVDADVFHNHSLNINLLEVKGSLRKRFKPEQIARFGNSHVVYPSLSRKSYQKIIKRRMKQVIDVVKEKSGIDVSVDKSVYEAIYRNGVFPVQGTRPVFSTITSFFEAVMPTFMFKCLSVGENKVNLWYEDKHLCANIKGEDIRVKNEGDIDKVKEQNSNENKLVKVSVHEAGHAVAYSILFGICPMQCTSNASGSDKNGFIGTHVMSQTPNIMKKLGQVYMAGRVAEIEFFGESNIGTGASGDLDAVTRLAADIQRTYAMGKRDCVVSLPQEGGIGYATNHEVDNLDIEDWVSERKKEATKIIRDKKELVREVADYLIKNEEFDLIKSSSDYINIFKKYGYEISWFEPKESYYTDYKGMYNK